MKYLDFKDYVYLALFILMLMLFTSGRVQADEVGDTEEFPAWMDYAACSVIERLRGNHDVADWWYARVPLFKKETEELTRYMTFVVTRLENASVHHLNRLAGECNLIGRSLLE